MFRTDLFEGKRFLVTGGGSGLGRIMMERFVELGADFGICGRRGAVLEETAQQVMAKHPGPRGGTPNVPTPGPPPRQGVVARLWAARPPEGMGKHTPR